ncbi:MAG: DUF1622 domain-containing protein [Deltaproteobacteria bacterium]|nr:DUF1622 domain-containing protein [Deltaproteobacteria bacterium]
METWIKTVAQYVALTAETMAVYFILAGIVQALWLYVREGLRRGGGHRVLLAMRRELGHNLSLSLEFLIGADVMKTAISPSWQDIGQLAAIVGIRTVLNFFLHHELGGTAGGEEETKT